MRSSLTRNVYRRLPACHGLIPPTCLLASHPVYRPYSRDPDCLAIYPPRRTLFSFFQKAPRQVKSQELEPGYPTLIEFQHRVFQGLKPQPKEELLNAFRQFTRYKANHGRSVNASQADFMQIIIPYLMQAGGDGKENVQLTISDLRKALDAILIPPRVWTDSHMRAARIIYDNIRKFSFEGPILRHNKADLELRSEDFAKYLRALTQYGSSIEAADLLIPYWRAQKALKGIGPDSPELKPLWPIILRGLANNEGNKSRLVHLAKDLLASGLEYSPEFHEVMTTFFAKESREDELMEWFSKPIAGGQLATPQTYLELVKFSTRPKKEVESAKKVLQSLCDSNPPKPLWDVILQWAVFRNSGAEDIKRMIDVMIQTNPEDPSTRPDIQTINGLIRAASENKNSLLADRFAVMAVELGMRPDATTYALQLEARIDGGDPTDALPVFENLIHMSSIDGEPTQIINRYIRYLCTRQARLGTNQLLDALSLVERRQTELEPETVIAVCRVFLRNDQSYEVIDTLSLHLLQLSREDRKLVSDEFVEYCLKKGVSTARAWNAYSLVRQFVPELSREDRTKLMQGFFERKRPDMACYVFGHMRGHNLQDFHPTLETYIKCLRGLAVHPDIESLKMVHNMFKMDTRIQPDTKLYNAFMLAYAVCEYPDTAYEFWEQIINSVEGPTYNSLEIVFRVCKILADGDDKAKEIWDKMERMDIDVPLRVRVSYCIALAGQGQLDEVKKLLDDITEVADTEPKWPVFAEIFNSLPRPGLQGALGEWLEERYSDIWDTLKSQKWKQTLEGPQQINAPKWPLRP